MVGTDSTAILLDAGAQANGISQQFYTENAQKIETHYRRLGPVMDDKCVELVGPDGPLPYSRIVYLPVQVGKKTWIDKFYVINALPVDVLLGSETMARQKVDIINSGGYALVQDPKSNSHTRCEFINPHTGLDAQTKSTKNDKYKQTYKLHILESISIPAGCEVLVNCTVGKLPKLRTKCTVLIDSVTTAGPRPHVYTARGIGLVQKGTTKAGIANLGTTSIMIPKGYVVGLCAIVNPDSFDVVDLGDLHDPTIGKNSRMINTILKEVNAVGSTKYPVTEKTGTTITVSADTLKAKISAYNLPEAINVGLDDLTETQLDKLLLLLQKFRHIFAKNPSNPGHVSRAVAEHVIDVQGSLPINQGPRRVSPQQRRIIKEHIDQLISAGIIRPSRSPWASPVLLVPKGESEYRMCIDYRKLNAVTKKEVYAIPRIDDVLDTLGGKMYFSTLDLASGYFQIPMAEESKNKTAFITYDGQYEYNFMSFGLVNAPSTFQRCMDTVLAGLKWNCVQVYLDDAIIASATFEQHIIDLTSVLNRFQEAGFKLKASKCFICCSEVAYLGHLITREGVRANPKKIELIKNWDIPTSVANLHSFVGLAGYYRKLISRYAQREAPLRALLKPNAVFKMGPVEVAAFKDIQQCLINDPIIASPDFSGNSKFEVHTDASDLGISAILTQIGPDGSEKVLHYASRQLTKEELKWHTQEKEALAIVWGCNKFRSYLLGAPFLLRTDHHSLQWLMRSEKGKLARWALSMSEFDYKIVHRAGKANTNADVASRWTTVPPEDNWDPFPYYADPIDMLNPKAEIKREVCTFCTTHHMGVKVNKSLPHDKMAYILNITKSSSVVDQLSDQVFIEPVTRTESNNLQELILTAQQGNAVVLQAVGFVLKQNQTEALKVLGKSFATSKTPVNLVVKDNLLCRVSTDSKTNKIRTQVIIPDDKVLKRLVLGYHHDDEMSGHFGHHRTLAKVRMNYFWPHIIRDCKLFVSTCPVCQAHKSKAPSLFGHKLHPSIPEGPNCRVSIDLIGPLPETDVNEAVYALVMVDYFTKWAVAVPLKNKEAGSVADAIYKNWYCRFGIPYEIQTDQGTEFCNDLLRRLNSRLSIGHRVTTPYNPSPNGEVERFNQTLKSHVSMYTEAHPGIWDRYLDGITWAYNSSLNPLTGFSPYYLTFGREPRLPTDILFGSIKDIVYDLDQYQTNITLHLRHAYDIVKNNLASYATKMKLKWDEKIHRDHTTFSKGDKILMYHPQANAKAGDNAHTHVWNRKWLGPYTVIGQKFQNNKDVYEVKDEVTKREWTINVNKLRPFREREYLDDSLDVHSSKETSHSAMRLDGNIPTVPLVDAQVQNALDVVNPNRKLKATPPGVRVPLKVTKKNLRSNTRHKTGLTRKEVRLSKRRELDSSADVTMDMLKEHEVTDIISHKRINRQIHYEVKWAAIDHTTWEPRSSFSTVTILKEYWAKFDNKLRPKEFQDKSKKTI